MSSVFFAISIDVLLIIVPVMYNALYWIKSSKVKIEVGWEQLVKLQGSEVWLPKKH